VISYQRKTALKEYIRLGAQALGPDVLGAPPLSSITNKWIDDTRLNFNGSKAENRLEYVKWLSIKCASCFGIEMPKVEIRFCTLNTHEAGRVLFKAGIWLIEIDQKHFWNDLSVTAIVAHEIAHVLLGLRGIQRSSKLDNEELTDCVAVLAGFGQVLQEAYLQRSINPFALMFGIISIKTKRLGYLTPKEIEYISWLKISIEKNLPVKRLCPIDTTSEYVDCLACGSKLRLPRRHGHWIVKCTICKMPQYLTFRTSNDKGSKAYYWFLKTLDQLRGFE